MRNTRNFFSAFAAVSVMLLLIAGCSSKSGPVEEFRPAEQEATKPSARFNPLDLSQDTEIIPRLHPKTAPIFAAQTADTSDVDSGIVVPDAKTSTERPLNVGIDTLNNQAFRIQLGATELFGDARKEKRIAEEIFDQPVYLDYEVPYYKIRVGSFADRISAERYLQKAKIAGYSNAWVVTVRVSVKETDPLYDEVPLLEFEENSGEEND